MGEAREAMLSHRRLLRVTALGAAMVLALETVAVTVAQSPAASTSGEKLLVGLVTKTESNPFFVKMREGASAKAAELGMDFTSCAGKIDTDNEGQVACIENLIAAGADGLLLVPSVPDAILPAIQKAKDAGMLVIALDTQTNPPDAVDATLATDNYQAGLYIGQWEMRSSATRPRPRSSAC